MTKVIEKGVALGLLNKRKSITRTGVVTAQATSNMLGSWKLSNEVIKVIETGFALGIDFNRKKDMVSEEIAKREKKDEDRFQEVS